jgi:hypothetical protein
VKEKIMDYDYGFDERRNELRELAFIDQSANYEVDQTSICVDEEGTYYLLTASGCSCWCGEYNEEQFSSFEALEASLLDEDRTYNPSLSGAHELLEEARKSL